MAALIRLLTRRPNPSAPVLAPHFPFTAESNPYRCQRTWPPDFAKLSAKHQFRLERRYRRRTKLKWARPTWTKIVKLTQWGSVLFVLVYGVLFLEMDEGRATPFDGVRRWYAEQVGGVFDDAREARAGEGRGRGIAEKG